MAISMQGTWTVSVKLKSAAFDQRFIIEGAKTGNGTYAGTTATSPVTVTGDYWAIRIQNNPGAGWIDSAERIKFPIATATQYKFDIESDDAGGDQDFNDLILTCSMSQSYGDFLVYGHAGYYSGPCLFNPCYPWWIVIESHAALLQALEYPDLKNLIERLYPARLKVPPKPGPGPDPGPFTPIVLPLGNAALPPKMAQAFQITTTTEAAGKATQSQPKNVEILRARAFTVSPAVSLNFDFNKIAVSSLIDRIRPFCLLGDLSGYALRFQEYDRTAAELAGGPYSGNGNRENLGQCITDMNGNYIFRFTRVLADFIFEATSDTAPGENPVVQSMPDVIVELLDTLAPGGVAYESAPYWNIPNLRRIDICVPGSVTRPAGCQGGRVYQQIGFIRVGIPQVTFDSDGRVTCTDNSAPYIPQTSCAAWGGNLRFSACFLSNATKSNVTQYTIQHRHRLSTGWSDWEFYQEPLKLQRVGFVNPQPVGPFDRTVDAPTLGLVTAKAYDNVELDFNWAASDWFTKAGITSSLAVYTPTPGPVEFQIQGYDSAGNRVPGKNDVITLFIDNENPILDISSVRMGSQVGGDCALFHLSGEPVPAVITVKFQATETYGFLGSYALTMQKCNSGGYAIKGDSGGKLSGTYVATSATSCNQLFGTQVPDEPLADSTDHVEVSVIPDGHTNWLEAGQNFATFVLNLAGTKRVTDGTQPGEYRFGPSQYFFGIEP